MDGGIASVSAINTGLPVRIKDISLEGVNHTLKTSWALLSHKVSRRQITPAQRQQQMARIIGGISIDDQGFARRDVVIEAVFEDLELKQQMVNDVETHCQSHTLFASNTSSFPIADIAAHAWRPENVIGLHYFSPVEKMPLVEVIPHLNTASDTLVTIVGAGAQPGQNTDCGGG